MNIELSYDFSLGISLVSFLAGFFLITLHIHPQGWKKKIKMDSWPYLSKGSPNFVSFFYKIHMSLSNIYIFDLMLCFLEKHMFSVLHQIDIIANKSLTYVLMF